MGEVSLRSQKDALQYVRLWTEPEFTYWSDKQGVYEVAPLKSVDNSFVLGDTYFIEEIRETPTDQLFAGVVADDWYAHSGLSAPKVRDRSDGWEIHRCLLIEHKVHETTELVKADGTYSLDVGKVIPINAPGERWQDPSLRK